MSWNPFKKLKMTDSTTDDVDQGIEKDQESDGHEMDKEAGPITAPKSSDENEAEKRKKSQLRSNIRQKLILGELPELKEHLPTTCKLTFRDPDEIHDFHVIIRPDEGTWRGGMFDFHILVPEEYNFQPPKVKCLTRVWHPNITEEGGAVCLSILRTGAIDETGWNPTRKLRDVIWGLNSLFTDLVSFTDPLNTEAAEEHQRSPEEFRQKVRNYIERYCYYNRY